MWKKTISFIAAFIAIATAFIFGRAINRQRISRDNASIDGIANGIRESGEVNHELGKRIDTAEKRVDTIKDITGDIRKDNQTAIRKLATARELLERAKKRADDNTHP